MAAGLEIHDAASTGDFDSLEEYLRTGKFDVNMKDEEWNNRTALHWACTKGYAECIRLLLDFGANGNSRSDTGWTPAHYAAETGKLHALRALHNSQVAVGLKDKYGDTPKRVAEIYGHAECAKFLDQCYMDEAAGVRVKGLSPKVTTVLRQKRASATFRISARTPSPVHGRISISSSISGPPSPSTISESPTSPHSFLNDSAVEEQIAKGINNSIDYVPDTIPDRET